MKIIVCDRCENEISQGEGEKFKITSLCDGSVTKVHLCDKCFGKFKDYFYKARSDEE